jgi:hypothetical protein
MVRERGAAPGQLSEAILELALAVEALVGYLEQPDHPLDDARHFALDAAEEATSVLKERNDLETSALVAQIRSTAVDLLRASGMGGTSSRQALEGVTRHASEQRALVEQDGTGAPADTARYLVKGYSPDGLEKRSAPRFVRASDD